MAALPDPPLMSVEEYLATSYPDGDREYLDGMVVERNLGTPGHSKLQKMLLLYLASFEKALDVEVLPECRMRIGETRYRVPDILVMIRPFRNTERALLDPPFLIVEVLSPDDRLKETIRRFRDYEALGVPYLVQMDPEDRTTFVYSSGSLIQRELEGFDVPERGFLPFHTREIFALLDEKLA